MPRIVKFDVSALPDIRVVGRAIRPEMSAQENPVPAFWEQCFRDGTFMALEGMAGSVFDPSYVGFMCDFSSGDGRFTYLCGMLMRAGTPVPEGFTSRDVTACAAAVGWIQGYEKMIYPVAHEMTRKEMRKQGYLEDEGAGWCMELYNRPRFTVPLENGEVILDYYIPCRYDVVGDTLDAVARA